MPPDRTAPETRPDQGRGGRITVVGGGVIGLACAWQLAARGHPTTLIAPAPGTDGASHVAAGMLAPVTEAHFGEGDLTALNLESAGRWKDFAAGIEASTGHNIGYDLSGTLTVALDTSDRATLDDLLAYQHSLGLTAHRRTASACRVIVPGLSPSVAGGIEVPGDHSVDNRALLHALVAACEAEGVGLVHDRVVALEPDRAVVLASGGRIGSDRILLAAGTSLPGIGGLAGAGLPEVRPVKGHILRLGPVPGCPTPSFLPRTVRGLARGRAIYLVPRRDGSVVVGATLEERADGAVVQAGAVHTLLDDARQLVPAIDELTLLEAQVGLRPATPDGRPCIGWTALPGVAVATGHYRNGFLLAPVTAAAVVALFDGQPLPAGVDALGTCGGWRTGGRTGGRVSQLSLTVNGDPMVVPGGSTIADVVTLVVGTENAKGIAVAVERDVVPRSAWVTTRARAGTCIEIVTAAAGG